jgi:endonuclease/exonuclease/phosphatase family metal-dependent hydrolase
MEKRVSNTTRNQTKRCPGKDFFIKGTKDLDERVFRRLVARRTRKLVRSDLGPIKDKKERLNAEQEIEKFYEKINLGEDFLPASFLRDGATRARAVCRIVIRRRENGGRIKGYGTGFLIAKGFLMTNNHVLKTKDEAEVSVAEFGFEEGREVVRVPLLPQRLFLTNEGLDFTIVACDDRELGQHEPIPLLRDPTTITRHDRVNIIQHPGGEPKQIAIHDNHVKKIKDRVLHYETDTQPGSSGSPVLNNDWDLVALHHAGWSENGGKATNEGIRISAIISYLLRRTHERSNERGAAEEILSKVSDTSPYLGFFDYHGVGQTDSKEIELPDFVGTPDFADVGFWNIEHFNDSISDERIETVADVLSRLSMDVMGLTEVQLGAMNRLISALAQRGDAMEYKYLDVPRSQDLAVLYDRDTSTVALLDDYLDRYTDQLNATTRSGKTAFPRKPLFAKCTVENEGGNNVEFIMIVVHLKAFGDAESRSRRRLSSRMLTEIIEDIRERENLPVVLGGDFNERWDTDVLRALKTSPDLFGLTADDATNNAISYVGSSHRSLIDHIVVSGDIQFGDIFGDDAAIVRLDGSVRDFSDKVSDHVPLVFRMIYRDNAIELKPVDEDRGISISIPKGVRNLRLGFE